MNAWLWYLPKSVRRNKTVKRLAKWLCSKITGHVDNPSEHGYGGGNFCDHWCRYCDCMFKIPRAECPSGKWMENVMNSEGIEENKL